MSNSKTTIFQIIIMCIFLTVSLAVWNLFIVPSHEPLTNFYILDKQYEGYNQVVDDVYGELSEPVLITDTLIFDILEDNDDKIILSGIVSSKSRQTNELLFYVENEYVVDPKTRMHLDREGKYFEFPAHTEKKDYDFFHPAVYFDDPMKFKGTDRLFGLDVYIFETTTRGKNISSAFPNFSSHTIHTDTVSTFWIEPITGNTIRFEKTWENYLVENGQRINLVEKGGKKTTTFSENIFADITALELERHFFNDVIVPSLILIMGFSVGFVWIFLSHIQRIKRESIHKKETEKLKDELATMISHEIKNPLSIIKICGELLSSGKDGSLNDLQQKRIKTILQSIDSVKELLTDFSELKKLELKQIPLDKSEVNLKEFLENSIESIRPFTAGKNIRLKLDLQESWTITCDQKRMSQVISNLVKNAIDFVLEDSGEIIVSAKKESDGTLFSVQDNGVGIAEENSEIIFERFHQLSVPAHIKHEGSGLGLAICKGIVEAHGGKIWLDKEFSGGSRFLFFIPNK